MFGVVCSCFFCFIEVVGFYVFGGIVVLFSIVFMFGVLVMVVGC